MRVNYLGKEKFQVLDGGYYKFEIIHNGRKQIFYITESFDVGRKNRKRIILDEKRDRVNDDVSRFVENHCLITEEMRNG